MSVFRTALTEADNSTFDVVKVCGAAAMAFLLALMAFAVIARSQVFNPLEFGGAVGTILAGIGGGCGLKVRTEAINQGNPQ